MPLPILPGSPMLQVLAADRSTVEKTLYLPPPDQDGCRLEWQEKQVLTELVDGSPRQRLLGYLPVLKLKYRVYDDLKLRSRSYGSAEGQVLGIQDLMQVLATGPGRLRISPGPTGAFENLLGNPGFETAGPNGRPLGWMLYNNGANAGTTFLQAPGGREGGQAAEAAWTSATATMGLTTASWLDAGAGAVQGGWKAGRPYKISVWAKATGAAVGRNLLLLFDQVPAFASGVQLGPEWAKHAWNITFIQGVNHQIDGKLFLTVDCGPGLGAGSLRFDQIQAEEARSGFRALVTRVPKPKLGPMGLAQDVEIEFTGYDVLPAPVLGSL